MNGTLFTRDADFKWRARTIEFAQFEDGDFIIPAHAGKGIERELSNAHFFYDEEIHGYWTMHFGRRQ